MEQQKEEKSTQSAWRRQEPVFLRNFQKQAVPQPFPQIPFQEHHPQHRKNRNQRIP